MKDRQAQTYLTLCNNGTIALTNKAREGKAKHKPCNKRQRKVEDTPSMMRHVKFTSKKSKLKNKQMTGLIAAETTSSIGIAYRPDKEGAGAVFDHQAFQLVTDRPTAILNATSISRPFDKAIRERPNFLKYGHNPIDRTDYKFPPICEQNHPAIGLLVIPGVSTDSFSSTEYKIRHAAETKMIQQAKLTGQPIFGICGGSWTLYQSYGGTLIPVEGHAYRGGMPRLSKNDSVVSNNKAFHRLNLKPGPTLLQAALRVQLNNGETLQVNSVHSYASSHKDIPQELIASATALGDATLTPSNAKPTDENTIEAFETIHGAPVLGIQWHPEAYDKHSEQARLVKYMAQAGQAYSNKRKMLSDFTEHFDDAQSKLKKTNKINFNNSVIKTSAHGYVNFSLFKLKKTDQLRHEDEARIEADNKMKYLLKR